MGVGHHPPLLALVFCDAKIITMEEKSKQRGGKREGSGRKKTNVRAVSFRIPQEIADILANVEHPKEWICDAILLKAKMEASKG